MQKKRHTADILPQSGTHILRALCIALATAFALALTGVNACHNPTQSVTKDTTPVQFGPDTSSGNFTWTWDTIAPQGTLYGVKVFNDTDVIVTGEFYLRDSTGAIDPTYYNFANWNGKTWEYRRIREENGYLSDLYGIVAFSPTDYWVFNGDALHWNGTAIETHMPNTNARIGWGTSSSSLYFIGAQGALNYFDGYNIRQINTGITMDNTGIWGGINPQTGREEVICVASNTFGLPMEKEVFSINGSTITQLPDSGLNWALSAIWFSPGKIYYVGGGGIFYKRNIYDSTRWDSVPSKIINGYTFFITAQDTNDIIAVGGDGDVIHWSGKSWQSYFKTTQINGNYYAVSMKDNFVCAVGEYDGAGTWQPAVLFGKR